MAKSPLILAALANDAVPNLTFTDVKSLSTNSVGGFDSAILTSGDGTHVVIRVPNNSAANAELEAELRALSALESSRDNLPFQFPKMLGASRDQRGATAAVFQFVYGNAIDVPSIASEGPLAESIGNAIAAIHNLDRGVVDDAHLPEYDPNQIVRTKVADLDRAAATGRVPAELLTRWEQALEDSELFRFQPSVIHGSLTGDTVLEQDNAVAGVLSWGGLRIGDPAEDFAWIFGAGLPELSDTVLMSYAISRSLRDGTLRQRAALYSELEMARWLVHGVSQNDSEIIDDALAMLAGLSEELSSGSLRPLVASAVTIAAAESAFIAAQEQTESGDWPVEIVDAVEALEAVDGLDVIDAVDAVGDVEDVEDVDLVSDLTEEITIVVTEELDDLVEEDGEPTNAGEDTRTRVIELPEKGENELF